MKWLMLVLLFHLLLICSKCNKVINVTSQDHLLWTYLCHHYNYTGDTTLLLLDTLYNISGNGSLCTINTNYSLTIQSNHSMATTIQCNSSNHVNTDHPTIGFAFTGSSSLTLQKVKFTGCGANLTTLDKEQLSIINSISSLVYFTQYHAAVLVFTEMSHLVMRDVSISQYYGFAIVAVNLHNGTLDSIDISMSTSVQISFQHDYNVGSGVILLYKEMSFNTSLHKVEIVKSTFLHNYESIVHNNFICVTDFYNSFVHKISPKPVINAAGLTIVYTQNDIEAQVSIENCVFKNNFGSIAGAMLVLHLNTTTHSKTIVSKNSVFDTNVIWNSKCYATGIVFVMFFDKAFKSLQMDTNLTNKIHYPLQVVNVTFTFQQNSDLNGQRGIIYMAVMNGKKLPVSFLFSDVILRNNLVSSSSVDSFFAASYPPTMESNIQILMNSVQVFDNNLLHSSSMILPVSFFHFSDINNITISGSAENPSNFSFNIGTVIEAVRSHITLKGHIVFHNNTGINGGAIMLIGDSLIYLTQGLRANFTNNRALSSGGAIYDLSSKSDVKYCTFQVNTTQCNDSLVLFENNKATVTGNSVFSSKLYDCYIGNDWVNSTDIYKSIFTIEPNGTYELSTIPKKLSCKIELKSSNIYLTECDSNTNITSYPGQKLTFLMSAIDAVNHSSYSIVTITAVKKINCGFISPINWLFSDNEISQVIKENKEPTAINVTIHTKNNMTLNSNGYILFTIPNVKIITVVKINLKSCPPGFELDKHKGSCVCSHVLSSIKIDGYTPNCTINTRTFNRPTITSWVGSMQVNNKTPPIFLLAIHCHYGYCNVGPNLDFFLYNNKERTFVLTSNNLSHHSSLCLNKREGILCSKCSTVNGVNYSVVFGSTECRQCSNWWLWTLILYVVAGPLLIYLLYALRLTLTTGTLNGIIFYVQIANAGLLDLFSIKSNQFLLSINFCMKTATFFISTMNLNLGFPLCFYNGMTELWKAGLCLVFPLYLLAIVTVFIILSRFSLRLSNRIAHSSVQVLVTVVHLSFSKLLLAIVDVLTPVQLYNSTSKEPQSAWFNDGSVTYGVGDHFVLMIVTSVIVGIFLIPYMLIILTGRLLMKSNKIREYLRPIYEAIHAPYKYNKQYWFTARQLLLIFVYIMYTTYRGRNLLLPFSIILPVYFVFVTVQAHLRPFKNMIVNLLDLSVMINYGIIVCTNWYFINEDQYCTSGILNITFVYIVMFTFSVAVFYHIVLVTGQQARFVGYINVVENSIKKMTKRLKKSRPVSHQRHFREELDSSFFDDSYSEYREPLISP